VDEVRVNLGLRGYDIKIGDGVLSELGNLCLARGLGSRAAVISNEIIGKHYRTQVVDALTSAGVRVDYVEIPDGEQFKNSDTLNRVYDGLIASGLGRDSFLVALGGGVIGDLAGFAAATYLRGIPVVQVPTTLLAQVDSSVGGKTGINHPLGKNLIGAFHQPSLVVIDTNTLATLPEREYRSGLAEVAKYGAVCDKRFFEFLSANAKKLVSREKNILQEAIKRSCMTKAAVVERDETEGGYRAVLNYGHTFAHAVECLTGYCRYLHGEAVAIGMVQAARLSDSRGYAGRNDTESIIGLLSVLGLPMSLPRFSAEKYHDVMIKDKKTRSDGILFVFNKGIGDCVIEKVTDWNFLLSHIPRED